MRPHYCCRLLAASPTTQVHSNNSIRATSATLYMHIPYAKINGKCEMHRMRMLSVMVSRFVRKSIRFTIQLAIVSCVVELRLATSFRHLHPLIAYSLWCAMRMQFCCTLNRLMGFDTSCIFFVVSPVLATTGIIRSSIFMSFFIPCPGNKRQNLFLFIHCVRTKECDPDIRNSHTSLLLLFACAYTQCATNTINDWSDGTRWHLFKHEVRDFFFRRTDC